MTDVDRRLETAKRYAVRQRNYRRARDRALTQLAQLYPNEYKTLLEREKANDEAQGRKWFDITGTTGNVDTRSTTSIDTEATTDNAGENEGNYGGEA